MSFRVSYDETRDCVVTSIAGPLTKEVVMAFFAEVGRVASEKKCMRVLSDLREAHIAASTTDIYQTAGTLGNNKISPAFKRAIVVSRDEDDYAFWETVCFNQGFQNVRIFQDYGEAEQWITSS
jgi:hypothetical protein